MATTEELYNVKWNNFYGVLHSNLRRYRKNADFADISLACEGRQILCHRLVLASASEYFEDLFSSEALKDADAHTIVYLKDVKFWQLEALVEFMYNGEITIGEENLRNVASVAHKLSIKGFIREADVVDEDIAKDLGLTGPAVETRKAETVKVEAPPKRKAINLVPTPTKIRKAGPVTRAQGNANRWMQPTIAKLEEVATPAELSKRDNLDCEVRPEVPGQEIDELEDGLEMTAVEVTLEESAITMSVESEPEDNTRGCASSHVEVSLGAGFGQRRKGTYKYSQEIRDSVLGTLHRSGMSLRQCSETFGIPRKTIAKWRQREREELANSKTTAVTQGATDDESSPTPSVGIDNRNGLIECTTRAGRFEAAMKYALSGVTVKQAAAAHSVPRTTLWAYMKRRGARTALKRLPTAPKSLASSTSRTVGALDDFPLFGISSLIEDVDGDENEM